MLFIWVFVSCALGVGSVFVLGGRMLVPVVSGVSLGGLLLISGFILFLYFILTSLGFWVITSRLHYSRQQLYPGLTFQVDGQTQTANPLITYDSGIFLLRPRFISQQRWLLQAIHHLFTQHNIQYWATGGTLIGLHRDSMILPWDDDLDFGVPLAHRDYLFSSEFGKLCSSRGLEAFILKGSSPGFATRAGGAIRIRKQGCVAPVADIFFHAYLPEHGKIFKLDGWRKSRLNLSKKEIWDKDWIYPTKSRLINGLSVSLPRDPKACLVQQYGDSVMNIAKKRSLLLSHCTQYCQPVFSIIWKRI